MTRFWMALFLTLALVGSGVALADRDEYKGRHHKDGMYGPGGMMGHMEMHEHPGFKKLDKKSQEALEKLDKEYAPKFKALADELAPHHEAMHKAVRTFPMDVGGVKAHHAEMQQIHAKMFELRLELMQKAQQAVGKDNWEMMHPENMGPGMMKRYK